MSSDLQVCMLCYIEYLPYQVRYLGSCWDRTLMMPNLILREAVLLMSFSFVFLFLRSSYAKTDNNWYINHHTHTRYISICRATHSHQSAYTRRMQPGSILLRWFVLRSCHTLQWPDRMHRSERRAWLSFATPTPSIIPNAALSTVYLPQWQMLYGERTLWRPSSLRRQLRWGQL